MNYKGLVYRYNIKKFLKAIDCFDKVLQINPKDVDAFYYKGLVYHDLKEY